MTGKEALDKLNYECIHCNGVDDEVSKEFNIIKRDLEVLEIIKKYSFVFVEDGQLKSGRYADIEILLDESDFDTKEEYELLKEVFGNDL